MKQERQRCEARIVSGSVYSGAIIRGCSHYAKWTTDDGHQVCTTHRFEARYGYRKSTAKEREA